MGKIFKEHILITFAVFFLVMIIIVPSVINVLMNFVGGNGTNDGWLGFWGGYLGATFTILGVFLQLRHENEVEKNRLKAEYSKKLREDSIESFLNIIDNFNSINMVYSKYYVNLNELINKYGITGENLNDFYKREKIDKAKDFVCEVYRIKKVLENEVSDLDVKYLKLSNLVSSYRIKQLPFLKFDKNNQSFADRETAAKSLLNLLKYTKQLFGITNYFTIIASFFETYLTDNDKENIVANLNARWLGDNIINVIKSANGKNVSNKLDEIIKNAEKLSQEYIR
ncbi:hypothetical protein KBX49_12170 [Liquorilactobacillus satsumensis]|uniref:hypothetical protein n=1 Tax=Liquorilactobacillus satsumensis TaxID=259059 RepID=UPI0021C31000|nr:hypothetical protein [Liquorilactobacillus satsumensis]MCP9358695.1 hypothetical protein [Liquorilactobacillus satsumensis]MCP9372644.1 hypothetical protein [Liquorilactobacillus satsumensis]